MHGSEGVKIIYFSLILDLDLRPGSAVAPVTTTSVSLMYAGEVSVLLLHTQNLQTC